ncbi:MAG TPA: PIG-L family deacetylase [Bacteroides sp.]|nr:PIG-L family deacetylase [Bacteroides sp.]
MNHFNKSIIVLHAHPDDTEAYSAGMLKQMADQGYEITIVTLTAGGLGSMSGHRERTIEIRTKEAEKAAAVLNADYYCMGQKDGYAYDDAESRITFTNLIRKVKAGIVITHLPMDYHPDHRVACNIAEAAAMVSSLPNVPCDEPHLELTPLLYHSATIDLSDPLGGDLPEPHFYLDVTSVMNTRDEMLSHHQSQIELMKHMHKMDNFFELMKQYNEKLGEKIGVKYAEVYWQHLGGGFQKEPLIQSELYKYVHKNRVQHEPNGIKV